MAEVWTPPGLDDIAASETVTHTYLNQLGNSLRFLAEKNYTAFTSPVSITATTEGTANQIVTSGALTYEAVPHLIEFFTPQVTSVDAVALTFVLEDVTTVVAGIFGRVDIDVPGANPNLPVKLEYRITPTAASHTYNVRAFTASGTATVQAGVSGAGTRAPGFIRITRIPT